MRVKKLLVWLLVGMIVVSNLSGMVNAVQTTNITVGSVEGKPGDTVDIEINVLYKPEQMASYTVRYLDIETGDPVADDKVINNLPVGAVVSETAIEVGGYQHATPFSHTITLQESDNEIIFYYREENFLTCYTVNYVDLRTSSPVAPKKVDCGHEIGSIVSETSIYIDGYIPFDPMEFTASLYIEYSIELDATAVYNNIVFYYLRDEDGIIPRDLGGYEIYCLDYNTGSPIFQDFFMGYVGENITIEAPDISGYEIYGSTSQSIELVEDSSQNKITFYYTESEPSYIPLALYSVSYGECSNTFFSRIRHKKYSWAPIGSTITENAVDIHNYRLVDFTEKTMDIVEMPDGNMLYFCYEYDPTVIVPELYLPLPSGEIEVILPDGTTQTVSVVDGEAIVTWTIPENFEADNYDVGVIYDGNDVYVSSNGIGNAVILPLNVIVEIRPNSGKPGDIIDISIAVTDENENPVRDGDIEVVLPDETNQTVSVANGEAVVRWAIPADFASGEYPINATYLGNSSYNSNNATANVDVKKASSGISGGGGSGGGGSSAKKDNCPNGDYSDSYYDGTCGQKPTQKDENKDNDSNENIDNSESDPNYSQEMNDAYKFAHFYGITTMPTIKEADMDGYIIRSHLAKMMSQFAINVVGAKPNIGKEGCDKFNDIANETDELKGYMKTACELGLMGLHADGKTVKENFDPNDYVTRAEFGTVLSRFLYLDENNLTTQEIQEGAEWYSKHLSALKLNGIMTQIDGERITTKELRGYVMLMLMRSVQK